MYLLTVKHRMILIGAHFLGRPVIQTIYAPWCACCLWNSSIIIAGQGTFVKPFGLKCSFLQCPSFCYDFVVQNVRFFPQTTHKWWKSSVRLHSPHLFAAPSSILGKGGKQGGKPLLLIQLAVIAKLILDQPINHTHPQKLHRGFIIGEDRLAAGAGGQCG